MRSRTQKRRGLYNAASGAGQVGSTLTLSGVEVSGGVFTVDLDFGAGVFDGNGRWLELAVRTNGLGTFTALSPRQALNAVPYAQFALTPAGPKGEPGVVGPQGPKGEAGAAGPEGLKGDKGDPGVFPTVGPVGINVPSPQSSVGLQVAPPAGSGDTLLLGGNLEGTLLVLGQTAADQGGNYIGSIKTRGTWGELQLNPGGSTVSVGRNDGADLEVNGSVVVDSAEINAGQLRPGLVLGGQSGEGIASRRTPGENRWGLDFYTAFENRMSIANNGNVGVGTTRPTARLEVNGTVKAQRFEGDGSGLRNVSGTIGTTTVVAWGWNVVRQTNVPEGLSGVTAITAGDGHTVALKQDGTVVAWGWNEYGQTNVLAGLSGVTAVAAGSAHTVALEQDGTVVAWGWNRFGQTNVPTGLSGVTAVAAGDGHTVALKQDGTVVAWGDNFFGQTSVPAGLSGVTAIAAGGNHTVALRQDGTVVAWGSNGAGQTNVPTGLNGITAIAAGDSRTVALKSDGTVVSWGLVAPMPSGLSGVTAIAAGLDIVALKQDGTVVAWGENNFGQSSVPAGLSGVTAIAVGGFHTVALTRLSAVSGNLVVQGTVTATAFNTTSDRNAKQGFQTVDPQGVLARVAAMPVTQWTFKSQPGEDHIGPMAQDFRAAFGLGADDRHIATVDADGIALAAIQGLNQKLEQENAELRQELEALKAAVRQLSRKHSSFNQP